MISSNLNYQYVSEKMVETMCDYFKKSNLHSAVLGISGGIDSTLVAALLSKVSERLESENYAFHFIGRSLPTPTTNDEEYRASILVGEVFCDDFKAADPSFIDQNARNFISGIQEGETGDTYLGSDFDSRLRLGNIKSRLRAVFLYDLAKVRKGIVIGTDNYTEYLLGFSTIGGDALYDYCPIQWLWKTEVFEMSKYLMMEYAEEHDFAKAHAIQASLALQPQDGLGISNTDLDQIGGKDYYEVDEVLKSYVEGNPVANTESSEKILGRHKASEFKRNWPVRIPREIYE